MELNKYTNESLLKMIHELFNKDKGIPKNSMLRTIATEEYGIDTVDNMSHLALHIAKEFSYRLEVALAPKPKVTKPKAEKKTSKQERFETELLENVGYIFEQYPTLNKLPIFAWGRYFKYECSGDPFESQIEEGFDDLVYTVEPNINFQRDLLCKIDKEVELDYSPDRAACVKIYNFDERGGKLIYIEKSEDGTLSVEVCDCSSPE